MADKTFDLLVIGAGPAGYTGAIRASQLGLKVACVERDPALGGTCLRIGCIPSKAMLESSERYEEAKKHLGQHGVIVGDVKLDLAALLKRKDNVVKTLTGGVAGLLRKNKIAHLHGEAAFTGGEPGAWRVDVRGNDGTTSVTARHVLIATGSKEAGLRGVEVDGVGVVTSTEALDFDRVPGHLVVIGAGAIGLELGSVWRRLGAEVTVLEYAPRILPTMDEELAQAAAKVFAKQGLKIRCGTKVTGARRNADGKGCTVSIEGQDDLQADRVLLAVGRLPNTAGLALDKVGLQTDARGRIPVGAHFATKAEGIYAVGDVIEGPMLAHKAEEEAVACVETLVTGTGHVNYGAVAYVVYTEPEVASVGETEQSLKERGVAYRKGSFPFAANGRARAQGSTEGMVKMLADATTDRVLGAHILATRAGELIQEVATSINFGASAEDVARTCHAHPTLSEAVKEAALAVDGRTLNL